MFIARRISVCLWLIRNISSSEKQQFFLLKSSQTDRNYLWRDICWYSNYNSHKETNVVGKKCSCTFSCVFIGVLIESNKVRMSHSCERLIFQGFNAYPWRTFWYTGPSKLGWYDVMIMILKSVTCRLTDWPWPAIARVAFVT